MASIQFWLIHWVHQPAKLTASENLVRNQARDDILAALGMTQLEIDFGEFVDHVIV